MTMDKTTQTLCGRLRNKGMFIEAERDPSVPPTNDVFYWCTHTQNCLGPDGRVCGLGECGPERECFEAL